MPVKLLTLNTSKYSENFCELVQMFEEAISAEIEPNKPGTLIGMYQTNGGIIAAISQSIPSCVSNFIDDRLEIGAIPKDSDCRGMS